MTTHDIFSNTPKLDERARTLITFWFCEQNDAASHGKSHAKWFRKNDDFDVEIRMRFLSLYDDGATGKLSHWRNTPHECLALIVLLDQFPRNMFRGSARAFATDAMARAATHHALAEKFDRDMLPVERQFVYLPLEHSESLDEQEQCLALMREISIYPETKDLHEWAEKHRVIIERFGRFPHRNAALGRESTAAEIEFLAQPGSGF